MSTHRLWQATGLPSGLLCVALLACGSPSSAPPSGPTGRPPTDSTPADSPPPDTGPRDSQPVDSPPPPTGDRRLDAQASLFLPTDQGLSLYDASWKQVRSWRWVDLVSTCTPHCFGEAGSEDEDGWLLTYVGGGFDFGGGVVRVDAEGGSTELLDGLAFPHDVVRDPVDGRLIVAQAFGNLAWFDPGDPIPVRWLNDQPDWEGLTPNSLDLLQQEERNLLVITTRGGGQDSPSGLISAWDISDPQAPFRAWRFPAEGYLNTPHGAVLRSVGGQWYLLYAHTLGKGGQDGSIGVARLVDPWSPPDYMADLTHPDPSYRHQFLRAVELSSDGRLYITDSGAEFANSYNRGQVAEAPFPELSPADLSGAISSGQRFVHLESWTPRLTQLSNPFEAWITRVPSP